jgi:hypothetical protein
MWTNSGFRRDALVREGNGDRAAGRQHLAPAILHHEELADFGLDHDVEVIAEIGAFTDRAGQRTALPRLAQQQRLRPDRDLGRADTETARRQADRGGADRDIGAAVSRRLHGDVDQIGVADKVRDEGVRGLLVEVARGAFLRDPGVRHHDDAVGDGERLLLIVGHIGHGQVEVLLQFADFLADAAAQLGVEIGERLVEEQHLRLQHQRTGDRDALLLAARELGRVAVLEALEADQRQLLQRHLLRLLLAEALHRRAIGGVVEHAHMREQRVGLEHHRDVAIGGRELGDVLAADQDLALAGDLEPGNHAQGRGLAAAGRAEQGDERAGLDGEVDVVDRRHRAVAHGDVAEFDGCGPGLRQLAAP